MSPFTILALLLTLAALSSYVNHRFVGLPNTAALMLVSLLLSLSFIVGSYFGLPFKDFLNDLLHQVDLSQSLLGGVLSFLLFAGALNLDLKQLREQRWRVFSLAFVSTLLSVGLAAAFAWLGISLAGHAGAAALLPAFRRADLPDRSRRRAVRPQKCPCSRLA